MYPVRTVNVFEADLPAFDGFAVQAKYSIMHGKEHSAEERAGMGATIEKVIADFKDADKYLVVAPHVELFNSLSAQAVSRHALFNPAIHFPPVRMVMKDW